MGRVRQTTNMIILDLDNRRITFKQDDEITFKQDVCRIVFKQDNTILFKQIKLTRGQTRKELDPDEVRMMFKIVLLQAAG